MEPRLTSFFLRTLVITHSASSSCQVSLHMNSPGKLKAAVCNHSWIVGHMHASICTLNWLYLETEVLA